MMWFLTRDNNVENERSPSQLLIPIVCWMHKAIATFGNDGRPNNEEAAIPGYLNNIRLVAYNIY